jgi:hypothetical protein
MLGATMEQSFAPHHDCPTASISGFDLLGACPEATAFSGTEITPIAIVVLLLVGLGFGIWKGTRSHRP